MSNINNWEELLNETNKHTDKIFLKLSLKINQTVRSFQKSRQPFDLLSVSNNHQEIFNNLKLMFEQLLIEKDITDLFVEIPSLTSHKNTIIFNMVGVGKWIKFHAGNASRIFFFDEEKTIISDKSLAEFLNKIDDVRSLYQYFGKEPYVYYKFKTMPNDDVVEYLKKYSVIPLEFNEISPVVNYSQVFGEKVLLDQTMVLTLCSNLSYQLPEPCGTDISNQNTEIINKYLENKIILVNQFVFEQAKHKISHMGNSDEKQRFEELCKKIVVVPDANNPRFYYLKDIELICVSVAEKEYAIIITASQRLANKIDTYYPEIPYKLFMGTQLSEKKNKC